MTRLILLILLAATPAFAQQPASQPASDSPSNVAPITPTAAAPSPSAAPGTEMPVQEWNAQDYEVSKPALNLLELDGYFRVRGDSIFNGTLGNDTFGTVIQGDPNSIAPPSTNYAATQNLRRLLTTSSGSISGANMRARITPTLNITEDIQLIATFDLFDDLILGSTPSSSPSNVPQVNILNAGQSSPTANWNALRDAVQLKRLYAKVATPLGELRFGRMPNQWGLGMYANSGDCMDCDYGDNVDRVAFVGMLGSFYIVPMIDFMSTGPSTASLTGPQGQARDLDTTDNATQLSLQLARKDAPDDIKEKLSRGELVINYGLWNMFRAQVKEATLYYQDPSATAYATTNNNVNSNLSKLDSRNAFAYVVDGWLKLQYKHFTLEYEGLFTYAKFELQKSSTDPSFSYNFARQWGMALDTRYDFTPNVFVRLRAGIASGDNTPGFGVGNDAYAKRGAYARFDSTIDNFQFNRDYRVDLLLFRELIGTVTGAYYVKPEVTYTFSNGLGGTFAPLFGQALYAANTPSGASSAKGTTTPLGVELDAEIYYHPKKMKGFEASISYGLLIPFDSFARPDLGAEHGTSVAQRLLVRLAVIF